MYRRRRKYEIDKTFTKGIQRGIAAGGENQNLNFFTKQIQRDFSAGGENLDFY